MKTFYWQITLLAFLLATTACAMQTEPAQWMPAPRDLPAGMDLVSKEEMVPKGAADLGMSRMLSHRYLNQSGCSSGNGLTEIEMQVMVFESKTGAGQYQFAFLMGGADMSVGNTARQGKMELTNEVGDSGTILWLSLDGRCSPPIGSRQTTVGFVRGNTFSTVLVAGAGNTVSDSDLKAEAIRLAKIVDAKLAAAGK